MGSDFVEKIKRSRLSIYDEIDQGSDLYFPTEVLEKVLENGLKGFSTRGMPLRTRSKEVKSVICKTLGYEIPKSFRKTKPRFPGQNFDTYIQKSNNLQIWNEEIAHDRRYVLIREQNEVLTTVRIVEGMQLMKLDTTGTLTKKYQARLKDKEGCHLYSKEDSSNLKEHVSACINKTTNKPNDPPQSRQILSIRSIYEKLKEIVGTKFQDYGSSQDRNRGAALHKLVCSKLGYDNYHDDGSYPDIKNQLLEVKLQTSPTIDLGLASPDSEKHLNMSFSNQTKIRIQDIRYAIFPAETDGHNVTIKGICVINGQDFYDQFPKFGGNIVNSKIQIPLPNGFL